MLIYSKQDAQLSFESNLNDAFLAGSSIYNNELIQVLQTHGKDVETVYLSERNARIDDLAFSRFRKSHEDADDRPYMPKLKKIVLDHNIKALPRVSAKQLLKYIANGVAIVGCDELNQHIIAKVMKMPAFSRELLALGSPLQLTQSVAKHLLAVDSKLNTIRSTVLAHKDALEREARRGLGDDVYEFTVREGDLAAKLTVFGNNRAQAESELAHALNNAYIQSVNQRVFGKPLSVASFKLSNVYQGEAIYNTYLARRWDNGHMSYAAGNAKTDITFGTELKTHQYEQNLLVARSPHLSIAPAFDVDAHTRTFVRNQLDASHNDEALLKVGLEVDGVGYPGRYGFPADTTEEDFAKAKQPRQSRKAAKGRVSQLGFLSGRKTTVDGVGYKGRYGLPEGSTETEYETAMSRVIRR